MASSPLSKRYCTALAFALLLSTILVIHQISVISQHDSWFMSLRNSTRERTLIGHVRSMTLEQRCVKEVLVRLQLPLSLDRYLLTDPLPKVLTLAQLSKPCRDFLTPSPVTEKRRQELACFLPQQWFERFGPHDQPRITGAIRLIADAFHKANVPLHIDAGTVLGSWRMHGQIPYDPDVDFFVLKEDEAKAKRTLEKLMATFPTMYDHYVNGNFWRLDVIRANKSRLFQIDIFIHRMDYAKKIIHSVQSPYKIKLEKLLPFLKRPFQGSLLLSWRNVTEYTRQVFGPDSLNVCKPHGWMTGHYKMHCPTRTVRCKELDFYFNFVRRWINRDGRMVEVLFNRTHVLSVFHSPVGV